MSDPESPPTCAHVDSDETLSRLAPSGQAGVVSGPASPGILFDPKRRAASRDLKLFVASFAAAISRLEMALGLRQRARVETAWRGFTEAVEAILCNVVAIALMKNSMPLAVPRGSDAMWSKSRYREPLYGQHFLDALDVMAHSEVCFLKLVARGYGSLSRKGQLTTYLPTERLLAEMPAGMLRWDALKRLEDSEVLILKGRKDKVSGRAAPIDYAETARTKRLRNEVRAINRSLDTAPFWIEPDGEGGLGQTKDDVPIDPTRRSVRRIFNSGSWYQGGRLFGGYWETMRSADRHLLRIASARHPEGEHVANVDYGQLFPRLAYLRAQAEPPEGDLYAFGQEGWARDGCKQVMNAMLLAEKPLGNWPEGAAPLFPKGTPLQEVVAAIRTFHPGLSELFDRGMGLTLMWIESLLLIDILKRLRYVGVVALPLHDSVLCGVSEVERAKEAMKAAFEAIAPYARAPYVEAKSTQKQ